MRFLLITYQVLFTTAITSLLGVVVAVVTASSPLTSILIGVGGFYLSVLTVWKKSKSRILEAVSASRLKNVGDYSDPHNFPLGFYTNLLVLFSCSVYVMWAVPLLLNLIGI